MSLTQLKVKYTVDNAGSNNTKCMSKLKQTVRKLKIVFTFILQLIDSIIEWTRYNRYGSPLIDQSYYLVFIHTKIAEANTIYNCVNILCNEEKHCSVLPLTKALCSRRDVKIMQSSRYCASLQIKL